MRYTVDIDKGNEFAKSIPGVGGFSGIYPLPDGQLLVSGADGVGTKINIAAVAGDYTTIGIDLVAMCVNCLLYTSPSPRDS